ncbi:MAG: anti-virulence regulator CigR family protein [Acidobacteriota bacterium]|nr:anti-virulence regulator CigR family protein [Acidobacteriota bacterium]
MRSFQLYALSRGLGVAIVVLGLATAEVEGQGRRDRAQADGGAVRVTVSLGAEVESSIRTFYANRPASGATSLPPGIRRNLARGKPLPPGIAKKAAPPALVSTLSIPTGYEIVEVGLDVFLVEAATAIVHDILMDVIR